MCNLYSLSKHQAGILQMVRAMTPDAGNFPPLPGIFPDYAAPVIRTNAVGERELAMPRWGMPSSKKATCPTLRPCTRSTASPRSPTWIATAP